MDAGRTNEVELMQAIRRLQQLIIQGTELIGPLDNDFKVIVLQIGSLLGRELNTSTWERRLTKQSVILDIIGTKLEQLPPGNNVQTNRLARLMRTFKDMMKIMGKVYTALHQRRCQMTILLRRLQEIKANLAPKAHVPPNKNKVEEVFPLEMWQMILDKVDEPADKLSAVNASQTLRELQSDYMTTWTIELVMSNLASQLTVEEILGCRLVCKSWCKGVEQYLLRRHSLNSSEGTKRVYTEIQGVSGLCRFNRAMNFHRQSGRSPYPSGALSLDAYTFGNGPVEGYFRGMIGWSGYHLSTLSYTCQNWSPSFENYDAAVDDTSPQALFYYFTLCDLLSHTPNLRRLFLKGSMDEPDAQVLSDTVTNFPLPALPNLESLSIGMNPSSNLCKWMLPAYSQQLTELSLADANSAPQWIQFVPLADIGQAFPFPNLKYLHVGSIEGYMNLRALVNLVKAPNLQKFLVDAYNPSETQIFDTNGERIDTRGIGVLLSILERYPKLEHLKVISSLVTNLQLTSTVRPGQYAPLTLKTLEIDASDTMSFSFLLRFPYLRRLILHHGKLHHKEAQQRMEYFTTQLEALELQSLFLYRADGHLAHFSGLSPLYSSNVWSVLPNLKEIIVHGSSCRNRGRTFLYSRDNYERSNGKPNVIGASELLEFLLI